MKPSYESRLIEFRRLIDKQDKVIIQALARRMRVSEKIGHLKRTHDVSVKQPARWQELMKKRLKLAIQLGLDSDFTEAFFSLIHHESIRVQQIIQKKTRK